MSFLCTEYVRFSHHASVRAVERYLRTSWAGFSSGSWLPFIRLTTSTFQIHFPMQNRMLEVLSWQILVRSNINVMSSSGKDAFVSLPEGIPWCHKYPTSCFFLIPCEKKGVGGVVLHLCVRWLYILTRSFCCFVPPLPAFAPRHRKLEKRPSDVIGARITFFHPICIFPCTKPSAAWRNDASCPSWWRHWRTLTHSDAPQTDTGCWAQRWSAAGVTRQRIMQITLRGDVRVVSFDPAQPKPRHWHIPKWRWYFHSNYTYGRVHLPLRKCFI